MPKCWNCNATVNKVIYAKINKPSVCPKCNCVYPEKPKLEAELTLLQDKYILDKSEKNKNAFFTPLYNLTYNIVCNYLKKTSKILDSERIDDIIQWTLTKLYSYYQKPNWKVDGSFTGYLSLVVLYPLYNIKQKENDASLSIYSTIGDTEKLLVDTLSSQYDKTEQVSVKTDSEVCLEKIDNMLHYLINQTIKNDNFYNAISSLLLLKHHISEVGNRFFTEVCKETDSRIIDDFNNMQEQFKKGIHNNWKI